MSAHLHIVVGSDSVTDRHTVKPLGLTLTFLHFNTHFVSFPAELFSVPLLNLASVDLPGHILNALYIQQKTPTMSSFRAPCFCLGKELVSPWTHEELVSIHLVL